MKKIIIALAALMVMAFAAVGAQADESLGHSCGGSGVALSPTWGAVGDNYVNPELNWQQNCGDGKTIEVELQHNTQAQPNTWVDANCFAGCTSQDYQFTTPSNLANHMVTRTDAQLWPTYCGNHAWIFRIHVWWNDGNDVTDNSILVNGPQNC